MKQSEKIVLETLRKTTLAYLSDVEYSTLEKEVEKEGIFNLTGTAGQILKSAVIKHGSHDQSSHGSWAGGGLGGGGGGATTPRNEQSAKAMSQSVSEFTLATNSVSGDVISSRNLQNKARMSDLHYSASKDADDALTAFRQNRYEDASQIMSSGLDKLNQVAILAEMDGIDSLPKLLEGVKRAESALVNYDNAMANLGE